MANPPPDFSFETTAFGLGKSCVVGVDEVGRGPLAGPVIAAAVRLDPACIPQGLNDSKRLSHAKRQRIADILWQTADVAVGQASVAEIDHLNILHASMLAMERAVAGLATPADHVLVDGNRIPPALRGRAKALVKGDSRCLSICGRLDRRENLARPADGGFGATAPRLRLGSQCRLPDKRASGRFAKSRCDPTP